MRQDSVGANAQVSEDGTRITGRRPLAPKLEHAHGETVERSLFRADDMKKLLETLSKDERSAEHS